MMMTVRHASDGTGLPRGRDRPWWGVLAASRDVDLPGALANARAAITKLAPDADLVVLEDATVEREFGWVFIYTTKLHRDTGDRRHAIPGIGPLAVEAIGGRVTFLSSTGPADRAIDDFERQWRARRKT